MLGSYAEQVPEVVESLGKYAELIIIFPGELESRGEGYILLFERLDHTLNLLLKTED